MCFIGAKPDRNDFANKPLYHKWFNNGSNLNQCSTRDLRLLVLQLSGERLD